MAHRVVRKVSFGSQSEKGLKTRETLMSVIDTLRLRHDDFVRKLSCVLDALARNRNADVSEFSNHYVRQNLRLPQRERNLIEY